MPEQQAPNFSISASLSAARASLIAILAIIALFLGIVAEGFSIYQGWQQIAINAAELPKRRAESCITQITAIGKMFSGEIGARPPTPPEVEQLYVECDPYYRAKKRAERSKQ